MLPYYQKSILPQVLRERVNAAVSVIDNKPPKTYRNLSWTLNKMEREGERQLRLQRRNRALAESLVTIRPNVDCWKEDFDRWKAGTGPRVRRETRYREIMCQNLVLYQRIQNQKSEYGDLTDNTSQKGIFLPYLLTPTTKNNETYNQFKKMPK